MNFEARCMNIPSGIKFTIGLLLPSSIATLLVALIMKDWSSLSSPETGTKEFGIFSVCMKIENHRSCENYYEVSGLLRFLQIMLILAVVLLFSAEIIGLSFAWACKSRYPLAISSLFSCLVICLCWGLFLAKSMDIIPNLAQSFNSEYSVGSSFSLSIVSSALALLSSIVTFISRPVQANSASHHRLSPHLRVPVSNIMVTDVPQSNFSQCRLPTYEECVFPSDLPPAYEEKA
ncbi:DgyrCDS141 [Dimorphilus gyrociliatus]|uniref:DgyrCDS141 n=1 Tax=Dimorphilus gyrociliatus TaxID=2664684 RepID=A0A7I8V830_9ANNE|nr:DgyrCDS141 [Dimorphilus gyrociliatus]